MKLDKILLHGLLKDKGITHLYHANSVATALTFIKQNGLLSRGAVERHNLYQTKQSSDRKDKIFGIWNDIFLDTNDLHHQFKRQNHYGPVLFKFSVDLLKKVKSEVWVTRDNPIHWNISMKTRERYFTSVRQIKSVWSGYKSEKRMFTLRNTSRAILFKYLEEIVLDDPGLTIGENDPYRIALRSLRKAVKGNNIHVDITTRNCPPNCWCKDNYLDQVKVTDIEKFFYPPRKLSK